MADEGKKTILRFPKGDSARPLQRLDSWRLLIVDDEPEVHRITKLVLKDKVIFGRYVEFHSAHSAAEGRAILQSVPNIAVILLDVVMESDDAGLKLAKWIRDDLKNDAVRIILRTGQPGRAPESRVIADYEINDYREKTELTADKLYSAVVNAIRGYRDIRMIQGSKRGMEMILDAAPTLFHLQSLKLFASGVLTQLISFFSATQDAAFLDISGFAAQIRPRGVVIAATGKYREFIDANLDEAITPRARAVVDLAVAGRRDVFEPGIFATCIEGPSGELGVIYLEDCPTLEEMDLKLISLYCTNVTAAFSNIRLYEELEAQLEEKTSLLKEVNHRVKNNLQIILSLISLAEEDPKLLPAEILGATKKRIASMTLVHECLFSAGGEDLVDFAGCVDDIVVELTKERGIAESAVRTQVSNFIVSLEKAIPAALLVGELVSLGLDAARRSREAGGTPEPLELSLWGEEDGRFRLALAIPAARSCLDETSLETQLIRVLADQLNARAETTDRGAGCLIEVSFSEEGRKAANSSAT
jgi:two-component sensor histidine kinase/CheY-like chemotaxis protein